MRLSARRHRGQLLARGDRRCWLTDDVGRCKRRVQASVISASQASEAGAWERMGGSTSDACFYALVARLDAKIDGVRRPRGGVAQPNAVCSRQWLHGGRWIHGWRVRSLPALLAAGLCVRMHSSRCVCACGCAGLRCRMGGSSIRRRQCRSPRIHAVGIRGGYIHAVGVQLQRQGGWPRQHLLAALGQRAQCAALGGGTAGFQGRRRQCAARRVGGVHMVVSMQWGYGFSGVEGGLGCLSAPHAAQRVRWAAHNCAAGVHMGGGVLTCRSLRVRVPLTASQVKRWECSSVSVAARAASEAPPRCTRLHQVFEGGGVPACSVPPAAW